MTVSSPALFLIVYEAGIRMQKEVREVCPLLLPSSINKLCYQGYVSSGVREGGVREGKTRGRGRGGGVVSRSQSLATRD